MATTKIRGITIEIGADTNPLVTAFKNTSSSLKDTERYLKDINSLLRFNPSDVNLLNERQIALNQAVAETSLKLKELRAIYEELPNAEDGQLTDEQKKLQQEITLTEGTLVKYKTQLNENTQALDKATKSTDELGKETDEAGKKAEGSINKWTILNGVLSNLATDIMRGAISGIKSLGNTLVDVGKQALNSYADYEQLAGGMEALFGESSAQKVIDNANNAFKTAGLSTNEYLETVTQFSASLIKSLGDDTDKAVGLADKALQDMGDNANRFGTSMESIQNAYRGFARGNYTMLDNLSLGYAGTKQGMEDLLARAQELSGQKFELGNFADMVEAIHIVQQDLNITGTTAQEASATIQGSTKQMASAWQNMLTGFADDTADYDKLVNDLVESVYTVLENVLPRLATIIDGISAFLLKVIPDLIPQLADILMPMIQDTMPQIISTLIITLVNALPLIIDIGIEIIDALIDGIIKATPTIVAQMPILIQKLIQSLAKAIPTILKSIPAMFGLIIQSIGGVLAGIGEVGKNLVQGLWNGINNAKQWVLDKIKGFGKSILNGLKSFFGIHSPSTLFRDQIGENLAKGIGVGFEDEMNDVAKMMQHSIPTSFDTTLATQPTNNGIGASQYSIVIEVNGTNNPQEVAEMVMDKLQLAVASEGRMWK